MTQPYADQRRRNEIRQAAARLRAMARRTPHWQVRERDGGLVVVDGFTGAVVVRLEGDWAPDLGRLFGMFGQVFLLRVVALMEAVAGGVEKPLEAAETLAGMVPPLDDHAEDTGGE